MDAGSRRNSLTKDTSEKGRVSGLINEFMAGTPRVRLITPVGYGADPIAKRLDAPREAVVYFRTNAPSKSPSLGVRCFGLFRSPNIFFAMSIMRKVVRSGQNDPVDQFVNPIMIFFGRAIREVDVTTHVDNLITP
ncbi:hypothetical protein JUN65_08315 [Gluconacetobacter azotocaptans]|uniref:hypothetical protein n=1 Tax=Gluconacetobacter azotocaptans TaxID=142834 RepID=UPI0019596219|nr:hypothetical protein [Gluconacetobacter azotocaptans]MBM9401589.1 hypothetical protein [Gluconacetobacter azotocaptans]